MPLQILTVFFYLIEEMYQSLLVEVSAKDLTSSLKKLYEALHKLNISDAEDLKDLITYIGSDLFFPAISLQFFKANGPPLCNRSLSTVPASLALSNCTNDSNC